ncbi:MAG: class I SAM-dependent methyltransferase [Rhodoferax sp.]|nr:class I SAM-dependent methyltransferase [Rhodoferax sp.]
MNPAAVIPPALDPQAARLLQRAYALDGPAASRELYRDWAQSYDHTMLQGLAYQSPQLVADLLAAHLPDRATPVLDIGCGTGLAGRRLAARGFACIDGLDISPEMMAVAQREGGYRNFITADLSRPLPLGDASYGGASCSGTFTHGHVDAGCLDELFRVLRPGAPFAFTVKREVYASLGFEAWLERAVAQGRIARVAWRLDRHYRNSRAPDGVFCVYRRIEGG